MIHILHLFYQGSILIWTRENLATFDGILYDESLPRRAAAVLALTCFFLKRTVDVRLGTLLPERVTI